MSLARRVGTLVESELAARARRRPLDEQTVLYESFAGNGMLCNPEALFRELVADTEFRRLRHVWALDDPAAHQRVLAQFADDPRVSFVRRRSARYYEVLGSAKYLVNNATFPTHFAKRAGQIYLNTWHGTPLKTMGYDVPAGAPDTVNVVRNLIAADYLLAPNDATEQMYLDSYRARNLFRGGVVRTGTPRIDRQFADAAQQERTRARLQGGGGCPPGAVATRRTVLYAPTWRGSFTAPNTDLRAMALDVHQLADSLGAGTRLLVKVHQCVAGVAAQHADLRDFLVPHDLPTNDVLAVTDALITDYSSIAVDFLVTGRPVLFYVPDLAGYQHSRGLYWQPEDWPGPVYDRVEDLADGLGRLGSGQPDDPARIHAAAYRAAQARYCAREDGRAAAQVVDVVFRQRDGGRVERDLGDGRTPLLLYIGQLVPNGITSSALNLLDTIDHDRFDVSVTYPQPTSALARGTEGLVHPRVRLLPRLGGTTWTKLRRTPRGHALPHGRVGHGGHRDLGRGRRGRDLRMADEWVRCFGASSFEHVVDFSGYSAFFARLLHARNAGTLAVWLHNEIAEELSSDGRDPQLRNQLHAVAGRYAQADSLVSVCDPLAQINTAQLAGHAPPELFTSAENTINAGRIVALAHEPMPIGDDGRPVLGPEAGDVITFVSVGRLSAQKNHPRLIEAFALVHLADPRTRLVIVGDGPLRAQLAAAARRAEVADAVIFTGLLPNPYPVLAAADCFVLSSDYEGQPMVLLEARVLALPIVSTRFATVRGALPAGAGLVVDRDVEALAHGMRAFLRGAVPVAAFDHVAHNRAAIGQFVAAACPTPVVPQLQ